jgi:hypothetical protein
MKAWAPTGEREQAEGRRDGFTRARIASTEAPHVSRREVLRLLGMSRDQQDEILKELEEERRGLWCWYRIRNHS